MTYAITETSATSKRTIKSGFATPQDAMAYIVSPHHRIVCAEEDSDNPGFWDLYLSSGRILAIEPTKGAFHDPMTGASSFAGSPDTLSFRIPRTRKILGVRIVLEPDDTYRMTFLGQRQKSFEVYDVAVKSGLYSDNLAPGFEEVTGLRTSLGALS